MVPPWLPLIGSTTDPNENPATMSVIAPAASTAVRTMPTAKAKASPTSTWTTSIPATAIGSDGMVWPWTASGVRPMDRPTATMPLTRAGTILDENRGARTNSGLTRARTRKNPVTLSLPI